MRQEVWIASGYLSILVMPVLMAAGMLLHHPALAFGVAVLAFPLARSVFGAYPWTTPVLWHETAATFLDRLPLVFAACLALSTAIVLDRIAAGAAATPTAAIGIALSLWMVMLFATCPAHELIHRRGAACTRVGWFVAGLSGYPLLVFEHAIHHGRSGDTARAEWPRVDESVWQFAGRRIRRIWGAANDLGIGTWRSGWTPVAKAIVVTGLTLLAFTLAGGWAGFLIYAVVMAGVTFGLQLMTYLQHWGLGDDSLSDAHVTPYSWEDDCLFQVWLTLNISFHQSHHLGQRQPYYRIGLTPGSPRMPAGYLILMVLCLFPPLWRRHMQPVLAHWKSHPMQALSPGRRLTCFDLYHGRPTSSITG